MDVCTAWGPQGPDCLALAMELQPGAPDAAAAEAAIESPGSRGVPRVGHGSLDLNMSILVDRYLGRPGARTRRSPVLPGRSSIPSAMLFLADPVRAAPTGAVTRSGPRRADARSRTCAGEKLLPAITSTGERFVESGNDRARHRPPRDILFELSPYETQERAAWRARAHGRAGWCHPCTLQPENKGSQPKNGVYAAFSLTHMRSREPHAPSPTALSFLSLTLRGCAEAAAAAEATARRRAALADPGRGADLARRRRDLHRH